MSQAEHISHTELKQSDTRICSHDICVTGGIPPTQPTLSRKAQAFSLIGQLLSVKTGIVDRSHPTPPPSPRVGLEGLSITFDTNPDKSHMGHRGVTVFSGQKT